MGCDKIRHRSAAAASQQIKDLERELSAAIPESASWRGINWEAESIYDVVKRDACYRDRAVLAAQRVAVGSRAC